MVDLVLRQRIVTTDPATASRALQDAFGAGEVTSERADLRFEQRSLVDDGISVTRLASRGSAVRAASTGSSDLVVLMVRAGGVRVRCRGTELDAGPDDLVLLPFNEAVELRWSHVVADLFSFPLSSFGHTLGSAEHALGISAPFLTPRSGELASLWRRFADLVARQVLDQAELYARDVVRAQMIDALTAVTVEAFALVNATEQETTRDEEVLHRAEAFLRAHLGDPISIPDVAAGAGVSVRGLQGVYQRRYETTPVSRLRRLRLEAARTALLHPAAGTTVGAVGRRVGYSNLGRFSAHYRSEFEEPPSRTLERARMRSLPGAPEDPAGG